MKRKSNKIENIKNKECNTQCCEELANNGNSSSPLLEIKIRSGNTTGCVKFYNIHYSSAIQYKKYPLYYQSYHK